MIGNVEVRGGENLLLDRRIVEVEVRKGIPEMGRRRPPEGGQSRWLGMLLTHPFDKLRAGSFRQRKAEEDGHPPPHANGVAERRISGHVPAIGVRVGVNKGDSLV